MQREQLQGITPLGIRHRWQPVRIPVEGHAHPVLIQQHQCLAIALEIIDLEILGVGCPTANPFDSDNRAILKRHQQKLALGKRLRVNQNLVHHLARILGREDEPIKLHQRFALIELPSQFAGHAVECRGQFLELVATGDPHLPTQIPFRYLARGHSQGLQWP